MNDESFEPLSEAPELPNLLPVLPLKETVLFPEAMTPLAIGQERSIRLIEDVVSDDQRLLALVTVRDPDVETPGWDDIYEIGTAAIVHKMIRVPDGTLRILVQGLERRSHATCRASSRASSGSCRTCRKSCRSQRRTSMTPARCATSSHRRCG
jgi:ATP-dependent Lon protease